MSICSHSFQTSSDTVYELSPHFCADDTQVYGSCSLCDVDSFLSRVSQCTCTVDIWVQSNRLQLDCDKTDFAWLTTNRSLHRLPTTGPTIGSVTVVPSQTLCDLGVLAMPIWRCGPRFSGLPLVDSLDCAVYAPSAATYRCPCFSR